MPIHDPLNVVTATESTAGRLNVYWDEYRSNRYLHLRFWYFDKKTGQHKPGVKGIAIPEQAIPAVLKAIKQVLASDHAKEADNQTSG